MSRSCPHLRLAGGPDVYVAAPDAENRCYAVSTPEPATVPAGFQRDVCLGDGHSHCARYLSGTPSRPSTAWLAWAQAALAFLWLSCCGLLSAAALLTDGLGLARPEAAVYLPPGAALTATTAAPTSTLTPETTQAAPGPQATEAAPSALPATSVPVTAATEVWTPAITATIALTPTSTPSPGSAEPVAIPTATRRPQSTTQPSSTPSPPPTSTLVPSATPTPLGCAGDETMTFSPASPRTGETVRIEVRSARAHSEVTLTGPGAPQWQGVVLDGTAYAWRWEISFSQAGTYAYSFAIRSGSLVCIADKAVTVVAPTATATPTPTSTPTPTPTSTPTPTPSYGLELVLIDPAEMEAPPGEVTTFHLKLTNTGEAESFDFGLELPAGLPGGWQAKYCDHLGCYDYTVLSRPFSLPAGGWEPLEIKLIAPLEAQSGMSVGARLWVRSAHGLSAAQDVLARVP